MIAALMLYAVAVTTLFAAAAVAAEQLLRLARRPARFVWIAAMLGAIGVSASRLQSGLTAPVAADRVTSSGRAVSWVGVHNGVVKTIDRLPAATIPSRPIPASISIVEGSPVTALDRPLVVAWFALSLLGVAIIMLSALRLARPRRAWTTATVDGTPVLVSHDVGPAVIGVLRYRIVLPAWSLRLSADERALILAHEREHANAGDPTLLLLSTLLIALTPWNVPLWWMARRLRFAMELDCDARVLRQRPDHTAYGSLLLDISERTLGGAMPIAALAEPVSLIERRIRAMTSRVPRFAVLRGVGAGLIAAALVIVACAAPHPASAPAPSQTAGSQTAGSQRAAQPDPSSAARQPIILRDTGSVERKAAILDSMTRLVQIELDSLRAQRVRQDTDYYFQVRVPKAAERSLESGDRTPINREWTANAMRFMRDSLVAARVTETAKERFPAAFTDHPGELDLIVLAFDSTGAVVRSGMKGRALLGKDESVRDRDLLEFVTPGVPIESFKEWGMFQIWTGGPAIARHVMVLYAFTGRAPWWRQF